MSEHNHENCNHDHEHDHDHEYITLVDEDGNESLYEILLTVDGEEEFGKSYVLLYPAGANDDDEDIELLAYAYEEAEDGLEGELKEIETDAEWDMIEEVLGSFMAEEENQ